MERQGSAEATVILILTNVKYQIHVVTRLVFAAILMVPMSKFSEILKFVSFFFQGANVIWVSNLFSIHPVTKDVKISTNVKSSMIFVVIQDLVLRVSTNKEVSGKNYRRSLIRVSQH